MKRSGIRKKVVVFVKSITSRVPRDKEALFREAQALMQLVIANRREIVYIDETIFTRHTMPKTAWPRKRINITIANQLCEMRRFNVLKQ